MNILTSNPYSEELSHKQAINALLSLINQISGKTLEENVHLEHNVIVDHDVVVDHHQADNVEEFFYYNVDIEPFIDNIESRFVNEHEEDQQPETVYEIMNADHGMYSICLM